MTLRLKIVVLLVALAGGATIAIGFTSYTNTRHELYEVVDRSLDDASRQLQGRPFDPDGDGDNDIGNGNGMPGGHDNVDPLFEQVVTQRINAAGDVVAPSRSVVLPVTDADRAIAAAGTGSAKRDIDVDGTPYRILTVATNRGAVQVARSTTEVSVALRQIRNNTLLGVALIGVAAALVGWLLARRVTSRLVHLTDAATVVATTGRLDVEVPVRGGDEAGQLGRAFHGMLETLARSRQQQQQLVQDAGHELRTPLTSLRTNVSVLRRYESLPPEARSQLVADLDSETRELTALVNELVELATDRRDDEPIRATSIAAIAERAAERTRRRTGREVTVDADGTIADVRAAAIERAIQNLVDNAAKFAPEGPVEVRSVGSDSAVRVTVRDHGAGLRPDDVEHLFDRFFRAVESRSLPGSGLGLAIVKSIVDGHGGSVFAGNAPGGGAEIGFTVPLRSGSVTDDGDREG